MSPPLLSTDLPRWPLRRGKVRDVYDLGDRLLIISTDRISAFDWVMPTGIPDKGRVLTQLSAFWFARLGVPHHLLSLDPRDAPLPPEVDPAPLVGRSMIVRKARVVPVECVARGYLVGSGWKEYQASRSVCGIELPAGLRQADALPRPIFTPATKAETGHDENISLARMVEAVGRETAERLKEATLSIYERGAEYARTRGIIIADTKFEFGFADGGAGEELLLVDEALTPDSSRFWPADEYAPGRNPPSYDKQFVRDWLETTGWDKNSPPPELPPDVVARTRAKYIDAFEVLTGTAFAWK